MAALRQGVDIRKTTYDSKPLNFTDPVYGKIEVNTDDHRYGGSVPIFNALVASDNTVFQQLDLDVGPDQVRQTAYDMGITSKLDAYPGGGPRRPADRRLAAGDDARVRDDQQRRLARAAGRDHEGRLPGRARGHLARQARGA